LAAAQNQYAQVIEYMDLGGSEDCSYFMERVQQRGGHAVYLMYGTELKAGHHSSNFDFGEDCLAPAVAMLTVLAAHFGAKA
jgi:aminobenzoyl-glutamate utilization protein A